MNFLVEIQPGDRLAQYTIGRTIGEGGMGVVYEATSERPERRVALKVLSPWLASELGRARFEQEVRTAAQLAHPNIVVIYDFGESEHGVLYYAMEYLDGFDLRRLVEEDGPQPPSRVLHILLQIASALGEAHAQGLVHRDIKPGNIILCELGGVPDVAKLVDFGLVLSLEPNRRLTLDGPVLGTPRYTAPEALVDGGVITAATDFYALGLVAFHLLTGRHAFDSLDSAEILRQQRDEPAPSLLDFGVPADLANVVAWCLEKDPAKRPDDARTLREALASCAAAGDWSDASAHAWWARIAGQADR